MYYRIINKKAQSLILKQKCFILITSILIFLTSEIYGQSTRTSEPVPPSPNASSLGKYGDIPVGKYTGIPDINIPLYTIKEGDISLPLSLSYHASGVRVEEESSWVGLGWSLNAGGVISRTMVGKPDELGYLTGTGSSVTNVATIPQVLLHPDSLMLSSSVCDIRNACLYGSNDVNGSLGNIDCQPDIYYFNFNGISGKFILDQQGNPYTIPFLKLKIEGAPNSTWIITTEDGFKYYFQDKEISNVATLNYGSYGGSFNDDNPIKTIQYTSAWYLTKIISPRNFQVKFTYKPENYTSYSGQSQLLLISFSNNVPNTNFYNSSGIYYPITTAVRNTLSGIVLDSILFSNGNIALLSSNTRVDLKQEGSAYALDRIKINNNNGIIKQYLFDKSYSLANDSSNYVKSRRLILNDVKEINADSSIVTTAYQFVYDQTHPLPSKLSTSQDHWGYYNGKNNIMAGTGVGTLIPSISSGSLSMSRDTAFKALASTVLSPITPILTNIFDATIKQFSLNAADRSPDLSYAQSGILKKIIYPTGGYTQFEYELNDYDLPVVQNGTTSHYNMQVGGLRIKAITDFIEDSAILIKKYSYRSSADSSISSGTILNLPSYIDRQDIVPNSSTYTQGPVFGYDTINAIYPVLYLSSGSKYELGQTCGSYVGYKEVKESLYKQNSSSLYPNGYKIFKYASGEDYPDLNTQTFGWLFWADEPGQYNAPGDWACSNSNLGTYYNMGYFRPSSIAAEANVYPYPPKTSMDWKRGLLLSEACFNSKGLLTKKNESFYNNVNDTSNRHVISGLKISTILKHLSSVMYFGRYDMIAAWNYKSKDIVTVIDSNNNSMVSTTNYYYDNPEHALLTRIESTNSKAEPIKTLYTYVGDESNLVGLSQDQLAVIAKLKSNYRYNTLLDYKTYNGNNAFLTLQRTLSYKDLGNGLILPITEVYKNNSATTENKFYYNQYDSLGNIEEQQNNFRAKEVYLWSYNKQYPVARIIGSDYATVNSVISQSQIDASKGNAASLRTILNILRTNAATKNAQTWTYTYDPLIGMTSETDPAGRTTYFEYDGLGRLKLVKDLNNNILEKYTYNYQVLYKNAQQQGTFSSTNCMYGSLPMTYVVTSGKYTSSYSQQDADQQAINDINNNGQSYVNRNAVCLNSLYAHLSTENINDYTQTNPDGTIDRGQTANIVIRFYADASLTQPVRVNSLKVSYNMSASGDCANFSNNNNINATGSSYTIASSVIINTTRQLGSNGDEATSSCTWTYKLVAGTGYIIK